MRRVGNHRETPDHADGGQQDRVGAKQKTGNHGADAADGHGRHGHGGAAITVGEKAAGETAGRPADANHQERRDPRPEYRVGAAEVIIDSPASDDDIERLKEAVESHCPVLDIIGNATPVAVTVRKKNIAPAAMHAL